jgi:hypothetical protein
MWETILLSFGGSAVLLTALGFLARSVINHYLSKDIEMFKSQLKASADLAQAELKSSLKLIATEHEIRFKSLHEKRALVLGELYAQMAEAVKLTRSFVSPLELIGEKSKQEQYRETMQKILDFYWYFDKHRIYLAQNQCDLIDAFVEKLREPSIDFSSYLDVPEFDKEIMKEKRKVWREAWKSVEEKVPSARKALEDEFRQILGVKVNGK